MASANETLISLINRGYIVLREIRADYASKKEAGCYNKETDTPDYQERTNRWATVVVEELRLIFPTQLEMNLFLNPDIPFGAVSGDYEYQALIRRFGYFVRGLVTIQQTSLAQYTDLPLQDRLYVEDIDSFRKVRDVNPAMVSPFLPNGFLDRTEDQVQLALEQILHVPFHKKDWSGEINDLYTANVVINGAHRATAFLLKGPGIGKKRMELSDCGKNGDQVVRLFSTAADLFVVQYVGPISEMLVKDVQGKVAERRALDKTANFLIMNGQDTARLLHAYGKL